MQVYIYLFSQLLDETNRKKKLEIIVVFTFSMPLSFFFLCIGFLLFPLSSHKSDLFCSFTEALLFLHLVTQNK